MDTLKQWAAGDFRPAGLRRYLAMEAVIFWHSAVPGVFGGGCGETFSPAETLAEIYAAASGYPLPGEFSPYAITGEATNWLASQNIPAITVELDNHTEIDWSQNLAGMQAVLEYVGTK